MPAFHVRLTAMASVVTVLALHMSSAKSEVEPLEGSPSGIDSREVIILQIDPAQRFQRMEGFGASGAWWPNYVAEFPAEERDHLLRLLFTDAGADLCTLRQDHQRSRRYSYSWHHHQEGQMNDRIDMHASGRRG